MQTHLWTINPYATNSTTPPASLIFRSASRLKNLALTTSGMSGNRPLPSTFEYPSGKRSRTGAVSVFFFVMYSSRLSCGTSDQSWIQTVSAGFVVCNSHSLHLHIMKPSQNFGRGDPASSCAGSRRHIPYLRSSTTPSISVPFSGNINVHERTLSRLMTGFQNWFCSLWKYRMPTLPK